MRCGRSDAGHALLLALFVLLLVSIAAALLAQSLDSRQRAQQTDLRRVRLDLMVDAAVEETLAGLAADRGYGGLDPSQFSIGEIRSSVQRVGESGVEIEAVATSGGRGRQVKIRGDFGARAVRVLEWSRSSLRPDRRGRRR